MTFSRIRRALSAVCLCFCVCAAPLFAGCASNTEETTAASSSAIAPNSNKIPEGAITSPADEQPGKGKNKGRKPD